MWQFLTKLNIQFLYNSSVSFLGTNPKDIITYVYKKNYAPRFVKIPKSATSE